MSGNDDKQEEKSMARHKSDNGTSPFVPPGTASGERPRRFADVVVGGQAGSEGKGALVAHLLRTGGYGASVRPGSSNAGHTVYDADGEPYVHQVIPSAATVTDDVDCYMAPEASFGLDEFFEEYQDMSDRRGEGNAASRVHVDPKAAIITHHHRVTEADRKLGEDIGSTVHGCGAVRVEKIWRSAGDVRLAEEYDCLNALALGRDHPAGRRVPDRLADHAMRGEPTLIEGTQGTHLSMNQSDYWPFTTSRDCTASAFLSSCGLAPTAARHTWAVFRRYPIRVGGRSGPMDGEEIDFETVADRAGHDEPPVEFTSVTNKKRRIFEWSWNQFEASLRLNDPDLLALTFLDYHDADNYGEQTWWGLTEGTREWVHSVDRRAREYNGSKVAFLKTGPKAEHAIDLRTEAGAASTSRWEANGLPSTAEDQNLGGNWFDEHPTPAVNYSQDPRSEENEMAFEWTEENTKQ